MSAPTIKTEQKKDPLRRVPITKPPFTLGDIKNVVPPHCFWRSFIRSLSYVVQDLLVISISYYIAATYFHVLLSR
ncbi:Delta(12)-fatty-acid desaturase, partial [Datura stramonium]|nr:Delta(12)-fatty-acid desaturase [Datura stramonium]